MRKKLIAGLVMALITTPAFSDWLNIGSWLLADDKGTFYEKDYLAQMNLKGRPLRIVFAYHPLALTLNDSSPSNYSISVDRSWMASKPSESLGGEFDLYFMFNESAVVDTNPDKAEIQNLLGFDDEYVVIVDSNGKVAWRSSSEERWRFAEHISPGFNVYVECPTSSKADCINQ